LISNINSIQYALEEEAQVPFESFLLAMINSIQNALEEEAKMPFSLISIRDALQQDLEEEDHIS
jgi:hypothetical protein